MSSGSNPDVVYANRVGFALWYAGAFGVATPQMSGMVSMLIPLVMNAPPVGAALPEPPTSTIIAELVNVVSVAILPMCSP